MTRAADHYAQLLAPIYVWMAGGFEAAVARGQAEIEAVCPIPSGESIAVDLGAGFGMHAIPLARRGYSVLAIDSSAVLLDVLRTHAEKLRVRAVEDDLLSFPRHLNEKANLVVCMGDTLTHLPDQHTVERLFSLVTESLHTGGQFIASFRDYTSPLLGERRFIPVRSDGDRILTCFLEYTPDHVMVHDVLHERDGSTWKMRVSAYPKLRLAPEWVSKALQSKSFTVRTEPGLSGMVRIVATRV